LIDHHYLGRDLVFLVGAPRSGTTWVQRLLASHPRVATGQESHLFSEFIGPQLRMWRRHARAAEQERGGVGPGCYHTEDEFLRILREYMLRLLRPIRAARREAEVFLEKTPGHALFLKEIDELLPEARFIHLIRDARDVVASLLEAAGSWGSGWAPGSARDAAALWVEHVRAARTAGLALGGRRYLEVRYEELHGDGVRVLEQLFEFLELPADRSTLEQYLSANRAEVLLSGGGTPIPVGGEFGDATGGYVREPPGFVGAARAGGWKQRLSFRQRAGVWQVAGRLMVELGYSTGLDRLALETFRPGLALSLRLSQRTR
jgi:hypothetical protein